MKLVALFSTVIVCVAGILFCVYHLGKDDGRSEEKSIATSEFHRYRADVENHIDLWMKDHQRAFREQLKQRCYNQ